MIAWGRALVSDVWAPITSRYVILSSLAWALFGWVLVERAHARWGRASFWAEHKRSDVNYAGFEVRMPYDRLPKGKLGIRVCFDLDGSPQYMMTASTLTNRRP